MARSSAAASAKTITGGCALASRPKDCRKRHTAGISICGSTGLSCTRGLDLASNGPWRGFVASPTFAKQSRFRERCTVSGPSLGSLPPAPRYGLRGVGCLKQMAYAVFQQFDSPLQSAELSYPHDCDGQMQLK